MPTVLRRDGFEFVIYFDDHNPPHVHVTKAGGEAKIELDPVIVAGVWRMKKKDVRDAKRITIEHQTHLLDRWREING
ncbi:MAG TPA: DUF4160 domain-containing protein [Blastocatellia bacterium]|nr:DUF4160 domain-containing protein [Blastocatellia bacterium]